MLTEYVLACIGAIVVTLAAALFIAWVIAFLYFRLIHSRFNVIFFKRGVRRLSIASWHPSRLTYNGDVRGDTEWPADDHVINERPFYLSYRIGRRRYFVMMGHIGDIRSNVIKGTHP